MASTVRLEKEHLIFSAAHFITFVTADGQEICETIHGHNYRVAAVVSGALNAHGYVIDFIWLRDALKAITSRLDHRVILPTQHPVIRVIPSEHETEVRYHDRRWVFPNDDVVLLDISNTTAEQIAAWAGQRLLHAMGEAGFEATAFDRIAVGIDENEGQWGWWERE